MSLYTGLTGKFKLGGVIALSGYLPLYETIDWETVHKPAILQCHGDDDSVVHYNIGVRTKERIEEQSFPNFTFKTYKRMGHTATEAVMSDVKEFLQKTLQKYLHAGPWGRSPGSGAAGPGLHAG